MSNMTVDNNKNFFINIIFKDKTTKKISIDKIIEIIKNISIDIENIDIQLLIKEVKRNIFNNISFSDFQKTLIMCSSAFIEREYNYTFLSSKILLNIIYDECLSCLNIKYEKKDLFIQNVHNIYLKVFKKYIKKGILDNRLDKKLNDFDLDMLSKKINFLNDRKFTYLSLKTLYDRYLIHNDNVVYELPQIFFMRVAMGLAIKEKDKNNKAIEFYNIISNFDYMPSTPTLFNAGTIRSQLSSCFLTTIPDDLSGIYNSMKDNALLSKFAGGIGNDWTCVRGMGSTIKSTNGKSLGIIPFMKVADSTTIAVNQGGKRKGAVCGYLETWHIDIEDFLELRKNTGDDRRRTHDMNTANWIPDLFMQRVVKNEMWTLFSPNEVQDLHELYGLEFKKKYEYYENNTKKLKLQFKKISAVALWRKILNMLFETGHPWITFKDPCNIRSPQQHCGIIHSSNLCTEITLNTSYNEIAVCNLGSINLINHIKNNGQLNKIKLKDTIKTAIRMLDNVIDVNYYTLEKTKISNLKHRPIGLGIMGLQDTLHKKNISYASQDAVEYSDYLMEFISYYAIECSINLAKERGKYSSYEGSLWSKGILPIDSINLLKNIRQEYLQQNSLYTLDWNKIRYNLKKYGIRNSNLLAIAPTATISNICGVSQSIEPIYQNIYVKSNMSGDFTIINPYLINNLKKINLWDSKMIQDIKYHNGSIQKILRIPKDIRELYLTAFELDPKWIIQSASRRQKWIDQSQSLNLYIDKPSGKKLDNLYKYAWYLGLKTTYYLRSLSATNTEKSTVEDKSLNAVRINNKEFCDINDEICEACQ